MYGVNIANISLTFWLKKYFDIFLQKNFFVCMRKAVRGHSETHQASALSFRNAVKQSTRGLTDTRRCLHIVLNVSGLLMSFNVQWKSPCLFCLFPSFSVSLSCRIYPCRIAIGLQPDIAKINTYFEKSTTFCNKNIIARLSGGQFMAKCYYFMSTRLIALWKYRFSGGKCLQTELVK